MASQSQHLRFKGSQGGDLAARLEQPPGSLLGYALFAHCFTCSKDLKAAVQITRALVEKGVAVLRFDFTGLGESDGDFSATDFSSNVEDLVAAADYLRTHRLAPRLLVGHSLGGAAVLKAAARIPEVEAVATIGAPSDTGHLRETLLASVGDLEPGDSAEVQLAGRSFRIGGQLLADLEVQNMERAIGELGRPLMIFHSPADEIVGIEHAARIYRAARHPKSFVSLDAASHLLERPADSRLVGEVLAAWAGRYLISDVPESVPDHRVVTVEGGPAGYAQLIRAGRHTLVADEPAELGGGDSGPDPYALLLSALGACKSMTMRMYADRKKWPLEGTSVELSHSRVHARDCAECESDSGLVDAIDVVLDVAGPLDPDQRKRILEIADRCPVHRTLTTETIIRSRSAED